MPSFLLCIPSRRISNLSTFHEARECKEEKVARRSVCADLSTRMLRHLASNHLILNCCMEADLDIGMAAKAEESSPSTEKKEKLSEIIERDTAKEHEQQQEKRIPGTTRSYMRLCMSCMRSQSRAFMKGIARRFQRIHNKVCLECRCQTDGQHCQPKVIFRVIEPKRCNSNPQKMDHAKNIRTSSSKKYSTSMVVRLASMNVALFSLAPALPGKISCTLVHSNACSSMECFNPTFNPAGPLPLASLLLEPVITPQETDSDSGIPRSFPSHHRCKLNPAFSPNPFYSFHSSPCIEFGSQQLKNSKASIFEVLRDAKADLIALQEVKADEERGMAPLSDLAEALGMHYAYAESWAPEFGNAILSRWPIKSTSVKRIHDNSDYRNLLRVVVDVPSLGEIHFCCTHLDHLDEDWRLKQVSSILEDTKKHPHFLAGDLNSLKRSDYSKERWADITKLRAENRKMAPRGDVMERLLNERGYKDAYTAAANEEEVEAAHGQEVQGTCKHGTRIDYILTSPQLPYHFVPGSYKVFSSRGTSDHHLITVDIQKG